MLNTADLYRLVVHVEKRQWQLASVGDPQQLQVVRSADKRHSVAERVARERLTDRYDAAVKTVAAFFGYAGQTGHLNLEIAMLVEHQGETVARLDESTEVNRAADTVVGRSPRR